jgi:hypothetical protein
VSDIACTRPPYPDLCAFTCANLHNDSACISCTTVRAVACVHNRRNEPRLLSRLSREGGISGYEPNSEWVVTKHSLIWPSNIGFGILHRTPMNNILLRCDDVKSWCFLEEISAHRPLITRDRTKSTWDPPRGVGIPFTYDTWRTPGHMLPWPTEMVHPGPHSTVMHVWSCCFM